MDANTRNLRNIKDKYADQHAENVRRRTASTCCLCFSVSVGSISFRNVCVYAEVLNNIVERIA